MSGRLSTKTCTSELLILGLGATLASPKFGMLGGEGETSLAPSTFF